MINPVSASPSATDSVIPRDVLLVESDAVATQIAELILGRIGFRVFKVEDAAEAFAILRLRSFDVVFIDVDLPDMDGCTLVHGIRQAESNRDLEGHVVESVIIGIVESTRDVLESKLRRCGMDTWVEMPLTTKKLEGAVVSALRGTRWD